jgi:hypothetical protein
MPCREQIGQEVWCSGTGVVKKIPTFSNFYQIPFIQFIALVTVQCASKLSSDGRICNMTPNSRAWEKRACPAITATNLTKQTALFHSDGWLEGRI